MFYFQDLRLNVHSCLDLHGNSMNEFERYQSDLLKWTEKTLNRIKKWQKHTSGRATFLEMLQAAIVFQRFPCVTKLILQKNFLRHIQKYAFCVMQ